MIRAGQGAFHSCFSAKQQGELSSNQKSEQLQLPHTANPQLELCATLPQGRMDLGQAGSLPLLPGEGRNGNCMEGTPFPAPATLSLPK